ncbi:E3 ubiquitin-protein ligase RING1-like [Ipomoea triloba]|uniref:E3 ubiquitin-protein ligase RING1-like n=1 Tax=Ipomoea triloba TaxID=35885 RepID=UPI00125DD606|nr:E3 ubiquitin-protein ligase RING1-like [Ipomoea triloba]
MPPPPSPAVPLHSRHLLIRCVASSSNGVASSSTALLPPSPAALPYPQHRLLIRGVASSSPCGASSSTTSPPPSPAAPHDIASSSNGVASSNGVLLIKWRPKLNQFHRWMLSLCRGVCDNLSEHIVQTAQRIGLANDGATVVTTSIEVVGRERQPPPTYINENNVVDSSSKPRGLSAEEIQRLKEDRFENVGDELAVCSVCLEKFLAGVKISSLPCSHVFHHGCISSWLEKSSSYPICRFDVTNYLATTCFYECS